MKNIFIIVAIAYFTSAQSFAGAAPFNSVVDKEFLQKNIMELTGMVATKLDGKEIRLGRRRTSAERRLAAQWINEQFSRLGLKSKVVSYNGNINNVIVDINPGLARPIYIGAHYDSIGGVGANDNASGVVGLLALAKFFAQSPVKISIKLLALDMEEGGQGSGYSVGTNFFVREMDPQDKINLLGFINFDMIGVKDFDVTAEERGTFIFRTCPEVSSGKFLEDLIKTSHASFGISAPAMTINSECMYSSDQEVFWENNLPAVQFFSGSFCKHDPCDSVDHIDYDYMYSIIKIVEKAVRDTVPKPLLN